jgi:hypothetical protein
MWGIAERELTGLSYHAAKEAARVLDGRRPRTAIRR